ncbi:MAG: type II toxin-antitoxin system VapC family toxin [Thermoguttaceae bacterium]
MILLDTDHINVLQSMGPQVAALRASMAASADQEFATTAITVEEQMRGWLALIHRYSDVHRQIPAYERLVGLFDFFARWHIPPFDEAAADEFNRLRGQRVRIGTMDLKIAATALANGALLLSANLRDFEQVPNLRVENWLVVRL